MTEQNVSERVLETIRRLLAKANDPASSPNEREQFLDEANRRMTRHAIDMAMLDASRTIGEKRKPTKKLITLYDGNFEWGAHFMSVIMAIAETNRCRYAFHTGYRSITIVGMQDDVEWVEMLWMNVFFQFTSRIQPTWDTESSVADNIYTFKNAGYKWKDIWEIGKHKLGSMPDGQSEFIPNKCKYMITGYKKTCVDRGTTPVGTQTFAAYKLTFTEYFTWEIKRRLEEMRAASKAEEDSTPGSAVALRDTSKDINDFFYLLFPTLSPEGMAKRDEIMRMEDEAAERRDAEYLASLSPAARKVILDKRKQEEARQARLNERYYRENSRKRRFDAAGASAGEQAGRKVDLTRSGPQTGAGRRTELN
jgi:hypothetical protein